MAYMQNSDLIGHKLTKRKVMGGEKRSPTSELPSLNVA
jgi:hypothetical protein